MFIYQFEKPWKLNGELKILIQDVKPDFTENTNNSSYTRTRVTEGSTLQGEEKQGEKQLNNTIHEGSVSASKKKKKKGNKTRIETM